MPISRDGAVAASAVFALAATLPRCAAPLPIRAGWAVVPPQLTATAAGDAAKRAKWTRPRSAFR